MNRGCFISTIVAVGILTVGLVFYFIQQRKKSPDNLRFEKPVYEDVIKKTVATGTIKPRLEINIKPQVSGVIEELYIDEGQVIEKGQKVAKIQLIPSQISINQAQTNVELSQLQVKEAARELERQKKIASQSLDVESARLNYENAKQEEERQRRLRDEGIISEQDYNRILLDLELRKTTYENTIISSENTLKQFETTLDIRRQELSSAVDNLQLLKEGAAKNSKQVSNIVTAPVSGMVLDIPVEEGSSVIERNNFNEGTTVAIIADMNALIFEGKVDESDVGRLKEGMPLVLKIGAIDSSAIDAFLEFIAPRGEKEEGTVKFEVRAAVKPTTNVFLRAGYSANGDVIMEKRINVLTVKERDILYEDKKAFVEVKKGDKVVEKIPITTGISDGLITEITSGLDTTMRVKVQQEVAQPAAASN
ncbi:MAG TPA: HlyD family efflux transporter periplasmic adaptor subunit [Saprospiraceae bacterium]|nr:HlyD family efflux transporter periplasmic adaptor subunit [Saprospiraceae bacterium]MCB9271294.1 HlyD family efflux transporter periplasmic adaptor subunit [Lewinellaceae bacterium]HPG07778.1 HlyD family efflux transporter periplasmic adaptor subunit [Saprospiraceae bacterium]HPQ98840.1 HlyD family efflux transporter periplasmic adaptor subunit [Saprospiraceae bacterium]HQU55389.1 HlyD family efflux transporter periplasmic adaptor subunit [Saprospiraceae bacterium]